MDTPLFSVIIPCYNAESYLEEAVCSVIGQTFSDIEVLIVDDASTDGSADVARRCAGFDSRVRLISLEENAGASEARNRGIAEAAGRYIMFLDSDDIYSAHLLERAAKAAAKDPDVIVWGAKEEYRGADDYIRRQVPVYCPEKSLRTAQEVREQVMMLEKRSLYGYLWNKAYRASLIKGVRILKQPFNEDIMFNIEVFCGVESAELLNICGTYYRIRPSGSLTHRELPSYYPVAMKRVAGLLLQHRLWGLYTPENRRDIADIYIRYMTSALERNWHPAMNMTDEDRKMFLHRVYASRLYRELVNYAAPSNPGLAAMAKALRSKDTAGCLRLSRGVYMVKTGLPSAFNSFKRG